MAYKKYIYRNGKKYGPYYYESYRDKDGKVKNVYVKGPVKNVKKGKAEPQIKKRAVKRIKTKKAHSRDRITKNKDYRNPVVILILLASLLLFLIFNKPAGFAVAGKEINININLSIDSSIIYIIMLAVILFVFRDKFSKKNWDKMKKKAKAVKKDISKLKNRVNFSVVLCVIVGLVLVAVLFNSYTGFSAFSSHINSTSENPAPLNTELSILFMRNVMIQYNLVVLGLLGLFFLFIYHNQSRKTK